MTLFLLIVELCFFFFKQKTAYEMRISDWSSDVCSSDLDLSSGAVPPHRRGHGCRHPALARSAARRRERRRTRHAQQGDRKSVVSGKSVSVRVDTGGRRIIKKKKTTEEAI